MVITFNKTVSKGSRFNQIYVPKHMENTIEVGDEVEVKLIKKHISLYYAKELKNVLTTITNVIFYLFLTYLML